MEPDNRYQRPSNYPVEQSGSVPPQNNPNLPYFLQPEATPPAPSRKPINKTLLFAGSALVLLAILAVVAMSIPDKKTTPASSAAPQVSLTKVTIDNVQFAYPATWQKIDTDATGFMLGYAADAKASQNGAALYYKKTLIIPDAPKVDKLNASQKQSIQDAIVSGVKEKNTAATGCQGFSLLSQKELDTSTYFGVDVAFSCNKNTTGVAVRELDRYLYTGDGYLYQVSITSLSSAWKGAAETLFTTMNQQIVPKAGA